MSTLRPPIAFPRALEWRTNGRGEVITVMPRSWAGL